MPEYAYHVYLLTNRNNSVIYVGVTGNLYGRILYHKDKINPKSFTARYRLNKLVYYEEFDDIELAIKREKQIKGGSRQDKIDLIESKNPEWEDLADNWYDNLKDKN